jgi:hypothetical protein
VHHFARRAGFLIPLLALLAAPVALAQRVTIPVQDARPADVSSLDGIITAFYDVVSGPKGAPRQWGRDATLYVPGVRFAEVGPRKGGAVAVHVVTHQQYVDQTDSSLVANGFFEKEIHRATQRFSDIAHIFSTYEERATAIGPVIGRGINSIDLYFDGTRWWITSASWEDERPGHPIPTEFLP